MISYNFKKRLYTSIALLFLTFLIFIYEPILLFFLLVVGNLSAIEFSLISKKILKKKLSRTILNAVFVIYIFIFCTLFFLLSVNPHSKIILFSFLLCCVFSDIGGYLFGKLFKGPKLTKVSPNKTIAGSIGSIILSSIVLSIIFLNFLPNAIYKIIFLAFIISAACQIGDIFFSYLKRRANLKDTGNLLPGHGGFLDRIDGILFGIPVGFIFLGILI